MKVWEKAMSNKQNHLEMPNFWSAHLEIPWAFCQMGMCHSVENPFTKFMVVLPIKTLCVGAEFWSALRPFNIHIAHARKDRKLSNPTAKQRCSDAIRAFLERPLGSHGLLQAQIIQPFITFSLPSWGAIPWEWLPWKPPRADWLPASVPGLRQRA